MTYCVGIQVREGLVFAADTRTSASFDDVSVHGKLHLFEVPGERVFVLLTSGNLATTQAVVARLRRDMASPQPAAGLATARDVAEAADYVGSLLVAAQAQVRDAAQHGVSVEATLVIGGQVAGSEPAIMLVYPLGNAIAASPETPYLQIGESKYGKPILDRIIDADTRLEDAARCALVSLDSTIRSNVSVGLPIDLVLVRTDALRVAERLRLDEDTPLYAEIHDTWSRKLEAAVRSLPKFAWEIPAPMPLARDVRVDAGDAQQQQQQ